MTVLKGSTEQDLKHSTDITPEELVELLIACDENAEKLLFKRYWQGLLFVLGRRVKERHLVEDLAQETIFLVLRKARNGEIHNPKSLNAFIRNTAINLLVAHQRKENRRATHSDEYIEYYAQNDGGDISHVQYCKSTLQMVEQLLSELTSPRDKKILQYFYLYEKDKHSICEDLQLSSAHFDRVLFRARSRLKHLLQQKVRSPQKKLNKFKLFIISIISVMPLFKAEFINNKHAPDNMRDNRTSHHISNILLKTKY